jgi:hypothetical protein
MRGSSLVYFERMNNTQTASVDTAIGKGKAAATYRRTTRVFMDAINKGGPATATLPGVFASPGGVPIMVEGKVTGAVGVSGATGGRAVLQSRPRDDMKHYIVAGFQNRNRSPTVGAMLLRWRKPKARPPFTCVNMIPE